MVSRVLSFPLLSIIFMVTFLVTCIPSSASLTFLIIEVAFGKDSGSIYKKGKNKKDKNFLVDTFIFTPLLFRYDPRNLGLKSIQYSWQKCHAVKKLTATAEEQSHQTALKELPRRP